MQSLSTKMYRLSQCLNLTFRGLLLLLPIWTICYWVFFNQLPDYLKLEYLSFLSDGNLSLTGMRRTLGCLVDCIPMSISLYIIALLAKLFKQYQQNCIFTKSNTQLYRKIGIALLAKVFIARLHNVLISLVISAQNPPGERLVSVSLDNQDLQLILVGFMTIVIAYIMEQAYQLQEDQTLTV